MSMEEKENGPKEERKKGFQFYKLFWKKGSDEKVVPFYKLFSFADRRDKFLMIMGTIGAVASGLAQPLMTLLLGHLINSFGTADRAHVLHEVLKVSLFFIYLAVGSAIAAFLQVSCWMVTGERQATRIRVLYLEAILKQDIAFFDTETSTGEVISRMTGDTILIQHAMGEKVGKFIQLVSTFLGGFAIAFWRGWLLSLVLLSCIPLVVPISVKIYSLIEDMAIYEEVAHTEAGSVVEQTIGAIRTVVAFTAEKMAINKYMDKIQNAYKATTRQDNIIGVSAGLMMFINFSSYGLAVWYGSKLIITKGYDGGVVINVISAIMLGGLSLGQTSPCLNAFAVGQAAAYKMFETINRQPKIDTNETSGIVMEDITGDIELKDVVFRYPARPRVDIFSKFSLKVKSGTTAALVGQSGCGKSTVISLLQRFYDPDAGEVLLDGVDVRNFKLKWLREQMGLVSQEPILFMTTIRENIAYGKANATDEEIRTAIELANAAKFIDKLPQGLDTMVGEHGTQLSGGQKQRIAIARAILKNPKILLLDEATSALDVESERVVQNALTTIMCNRTTVVVAHRLTTIRNADLIAVVQQGRIKEQGSHDELIKAPDGAYSQLIRLQEGENKDQHKQSIEPEDKEISEHVAIPKDNIASQILSSLRSLSKGSSLSLRRSFAINSGLPSIGIQTEFELEEGKQEIGAKNGKRKKKVSLMRLAYLNKPELPILLLGTFATAIFGAIYPLFGLLQAKAVKIYYEPHNKLKTDSSFWACMYVSLGVVGLIVQPLRHILFGVAGGKLIRRIRSMTFERVVHQEISWFDDPNNSSGAVGARLSTDAMAVKTIVGEVLSDYVWNMVTAIYALVIAFTANWIMALVILALFPLIFLEGYFKQKFVRGFGKDAKVMYEEASKIATDAVGNIRTVASFCAEKKVMEMYDKRCELPMKLGYRVGLASGTGFGISLFALYCAYAISFYIGALLVHSGKATFVEVFKVFFALTISGSVLSQSMSMSLDINKVKDSTASIIEILENETKIDSSSNEGTTLTDLKAEIEFKHVSFKYPTRPEFQIFTDLCLQIPSGKTVALVGESGSGKSTVISLIERFYDPDSGQIFLDGVEIKTLKLNWLRQQMGLVSQEPVLFNETIRTNIAYGKEDATEDQIIAAAEASNAHNFISSLPEGYDTNVGERGVQLSGGQKQRIAIARAVVKDPKILLLDEATSALDAESEKVVQEALDRVMIDRTTVVVAHRLSTIKGADVIVVVKNGVVAEEGTHDELMIKGGTYTSLVALHASSSPS